MCVRMHICRIKLLKASLFNEKIAKSSAVESLTVNVYPPPGARPLILYKLM